MHSNPLMSFFFGLPSFLSNTTTILSRYGYKLLLILLLPILVSCSDAPVSVVKLTGPTMGTTWSISYYPDQNTISAKELKTLIARLLNSVNQSMSTYISDSELSTFNQSQSTDVVDVSYGLHKVVKAGLDISQASNGAFDITVAPLVNLWGFGPDKSLKAPSQTAIDNAKQHMGYKKITLTSSPNSLQKADAKIAIDLSAIAKGYAVDEVANLLSSYQIKNFLVEIGGEIKVQGKKPKQAWQVAIEKPNDGAPSPMKTLSLKDMGVATSGDYRNYYQYQGRRVSHTIDPNTGYPVEHNVASVTVLHPSTMMADGWATAMMVLGEEQGMTLAKKLNLAVHFIIRQTDGQSFNTLSSPSFDDLIK